MFEIKSPNATLEHLNLRAESSGDDFVPAVDLKFQCESDDKMAGYLMGAIDEDEESIPPLWRDDKGREKKYYGISGQIGSLAEFDDCVVKFKDVEMKGVKVNKFAFEPISGGRIILTLRVQLRPTDKQLAKLSHYQRKGGKLEVSTEQDFDLTEEGQMELDG